MRPHARARAHVRTTLHVTPTRRTRNQRRRRALQVLLAQAVRTQRANANTTHTLWRRARFAAEVQRLVCESGYGRRGRMAASGSAPPTSTPLAPAASPPLTLPLVYELHSHGLLEIQASAARACATLASAPIAPAPPMGNRTPAFVLRLAPAQRADSPVSPHTPPPIKNRSLGWGQLPRRE